MPTYGARYAKVWTLQEHRDAGYRILAFCSRAIPPCSHSQELELDALIAAFGPDWDVVAGHDAMAARLTCEKCGTRYPSFIRMPPSKGAVRQGGLAV